MKQSDQQRSDRRWPSLIKQFELHFEVSFGALAGRAGKLDTIPEFCTLKSVGVESYVGSILKFATKKFFIKPKFSEKNTSN